MGAPPPTGVTEFIVRVTIRTNGVRRQDFPGFRASVEKILRKYGYENNDPFDGDNPNGLRWDLLSSRDEIVYEVKYEGESLRKRADLTRRGKFMGAYKALRTELEMLGRDKGATVNEWIDVLYQGESLSDKFGKGSDEAKVVPKTPTEIARGSSPARGPRRRDSGNP